MTARELISNNLSLPALQGKIKRFEMVEVGKNIGGIPTGTTGRVAFDDQPQLRNQPGQIIIIINIEVFLDTVYGHSQFTPAIAGTPAAELPKLVLVLYVSGEESIHYLPLAKLNHINDAVPNPFQWDVQGFDRLSDVDWDKSYVQYNAASANGPYIIPFGITYLRFKSDPSNQNADGTPTWVEK